MLSAVIPTLNAAGVLPPTLAAIAAHVDDIVIVDGGSTDATIPLAEQAGARVERTARGRGIQLAHGVAAARGEWLLLLHADTRLAADWVGAARIHMRVPARAGYFRFRLDSDEPQARRLERRVAWRCRVFALPYGDQGLLIHRDLLQAVGGVPPWPLMEDVAVVRRLGRARLAALGADAITSAARWRRDGWRRRSMRNLLCLGLYLLGVPPTLIARIYA